MLETICDLEWESSPELATLKKKNWLVNLRGLPNSHMEGDLMQEHLNRDLQTMLSRGDLEWDANFARNIVSPNIARLSEIKKAWSVSLSMKTSSGAHTSPHSKPEVRRLLDSYKESALHMFCEGRAYCDPENDHGARFERGFEKLEAGLVQKWAVKTSRARGLLSKHEKNTQHLFEDVEQTDCTESQNLANMDIENDSDSALELGANNEIERPMFDLRTATVVDGQTEFLPFSQESEDAAVLKLIEDAVEDDEWDAFEDVFEL
jgi:hypothetical protein